MGDIRKHERKNLRENFVGFFTGKNMKSQKRLLYKKKVGIRYELCTRGKLETYVENTQFK